MDSGIPTPRDPRDGEPADLQEGVYRRAPAELRPRTHRQTARASMNRGTSPGETTLLFRRQADGRTPHGLDIRDSLPARKPLDTWKESETRALHHGPDRAAHAGGGNRSRPHGTEAVPGSGPGGSRTSGV